jgi:hypothetical protein
MIIRLRTAKEAEDLLRHCLEDGKVIPTKHFRDELANENLTLEDAWIVFRRGRIYNPPEPDLKTGEWRYRIEVFEPDGKWIAIVFCFRTMDQAILITIFSIESRSKPKT